MTRTVPPRSANNRYPQIGELRHRITIEENIKVSDGLGGQTETWQAIATNPQVWAKIDPVSGLERFFSERLEENISHKITIRYRSDLIGKTEWRLNFGGRIFQMKSIRSMLERKDFLIIDAIEGTAT